MSDIDAAGDPNTSPDELGKLANHSDPKVAEAAAANPSTPQWAKNRAQSRIQRTVESASPANHKTVPQFSSTSRGPSRGRSKSAINKVIAAVASLNIAFFASYFAGVTALLIGTVCSGILLVWASVENNE